MSIRIKHFGLSRYDTHTQSHTSPHTHRTLSTLMILSDICPLVAELISLPWLTENKGRLFPMWLIRIQANTRSPNSWMYTCRQTGGTCFTPGLSPVWMHTHLSLISHFFIKALSSCLCSVLVPTFNLQLSPGFNFSVFRPPLFMLFLPPLPSVGLPPWLWPVVGLSVLVKYSAGLVWSWGDLAHCLWLHPSSSSFILLWNWIGVESRQELCSDSSYHCKGLINWDIFSLVIAQVTLLKLFGFYFSGLLLFFLLWCTV